MSLKPTFLLFFSLSTLLACNNETTSSLAPNNQSTEGTNTTNVREEAVSYSADGVEMEGYIAYDENKQGPRPVVLVVHEWWGLTDYPRKRAKMLAEMGYLAMAVDMYGNGKQANDPKAAEEAATPFYMDPQLAKARLDAVLAKARSFPQADTSKTAAIGYCFGGSMVLNYAKMGAPVDGVVSFHGVLEGVQPQKGTSAQFLVCHGGADPFVPQHQVNAFRKSMDSAGLACTFKVYDSATHAFTNPEATAKGKQFNMPISYNGAADTASWNDMKAFFDKVLR